MTISERDLRKIDLNLLVAFHVLVREKSVSRAAERLFLGQPAMSGALSRLREILQDELLVRTARGMEPTTKALAVHAQLAPALESIQAALFDQPRFDPATDSRTFTLGMRDWVEVWLMPVLLEHMQRAAPLVRIAVRASDLHRGTQMLENDEMDLGVSVFPEGPSWQRRERLATMPYLSVYDGRRLGLGAPIALDQFLSYPHLFTSPQGEFHGNIDEALVKLGRQRTVLYNTTRFGALPFLLKRVAVIATVPVMAAQRWAERFDLTVSPVPFELNPFELSLIWHGKRDGDPGLQWLIGVIREIVETELRETSMPGTAYNAAGARGPKGSLR
jgi:DNA-binding transcriptional LysR family regulator